MAIGRMPGRRQWRKENIEPPTVKCKEEIKDDVERYYWDHT